MAAIGAIGLNLVTGYAGQVSLGHAFFIGIGAYTGRGDQRRSGRRVIGYGLTFCRCGCWPPGWSPGSPG